MTSSIDSKTDKPDVDGDQVVKVWDYFSQQTTLHGVKNIESKDRHKNSRALWFFLVLCMAGGLIYTVASLMVEYYQYNTVTRTDIAMSTSSYFPSITLCNMCTFKREGGPHDGALAAFAANLSIFKGKFPLNLSDPDMLLMLNTEASKIFTDNIYSAEELFISAFYESQELNVAEAFEALDTAGGRCFTFNGPKYVDQHGPREVTLDGRNSGLRVTVHLHQDQYFISDDITAGMRMYVYHHMTRPRLLQDGTDIHPGTSTKIGLNPIKYTFLPPPYESYGTETCENIDPVEYSYKVFNSTYYSYELCIDQCLSREASLICDCYSALYMNVPDLKECTFGELVNCFEVKKANLSSDICNCPLPCTFTRYDTTVSSSQRPSRVAAEFLRQELNASDINALREDYLELRVYMDTLLVRHERHEPQFTFNSILAFLGGQMGFFIGASLITMAELLETMLISFYLCLRKAFERLKKVRVATDPVKQAWT